MLCTEQRTYDLKYAHNTKCLLPERHDTPH